MHRKICILIAVMAFVILSAGCVFGEVAIDEEHFPDGTFRAYVMMYFDKDSNGLLSDTEIEEANSIDLCSFDPYTYCVTSLKGIEYLTYLQSLTCYFNGLTTLDLSHNKALTDVDCSCNRLIEINVSGCTNLKTLYCDHNMLTALDVSTCTALTSLNCSNNHLTALDVSRNTALTRLGCSFNYITQLDLRQNVALCTELGNQLARSIMEDRFKFHRINMNGWADIYFDEAALALGNSTNPDSIFPFTLSYHYLSGLTITPNLTPHEDANSFTWYESNINNYLPSAANNIGGVTCGFYENSDYTAFTVVNDFGDIGGKFVSYSTNGIVLFADNNAYPSLRNLQYIGLYYRVTSLFNSRVRIYKNVGEFPVPFIFEPPLLKPVNIQIDVIEGKLDADKIICSMDEEHYYGKDGQALTEQSIADYPYSEYGKLGFTADGNSRLILRVKSDKPGRALFSLSNGEISLEKLTDRKNMDINVYGGYEHGVYCVEASKISEGVYQASVVLIAPKSFPENKKFPSDKFNVNVSFITEEEIDDFKTPDRYNLYGYNSIRAKYHTADAKAVELKIEAAPVLLIPGMFDNAGKTFGRYNNTGIWSALQRCGFKEERIYEWDYDEHKNEGPNQVLAENNNDLFKKLAVILNDYAGGGIVCTKVDVIAHGMGGLMARKFLHESGKDSHDGNNWTVRSYKQGMVRRLITVATPHGGTPWADGLDKKIFITTMYNGLLNSTFKEEHPNVEKLLKPFTLLINTVVPSQELLNNFLTIINSAWSELKTTKAREYGLPAGVPIHVIAGDSRADNAIQTIWTGVTTLVDKVGGANLDVFNLPSFTLGNLGKLCEWISDKLKNIPKGQLLKLKLKIAGKVLGTISFVWDFPSIIKILADVANFSVFNFNPNDFIVSVSSAAPYFIAKTVYANEGVDIFSPENNDRYSHWSICQQLDVGLDIAYLLKGPAYNFTTFDSEVYEHILSTSNKSASNVGTFPDDIDDSAEFEIAESLDLTVEPSVFALNTNSQTVKITLTSAKPLSNDVFCTFGNDDTYRFFKMPNSNSARTKFEAAFDASALFVSMDNGTIEFLCMSCISDDDGISGMYVSNTVSVDISGQTPAELIAPKITAATLEEGTVNRSYSAELKASGTPLIYWRIVGGKLPSGLGLSSFGKISGTPYETGTFTFTAEAINTAGAISHEFTLIIHTEDETAIVIDENTFPDENFRTFIKETFDSDNDGKLTLNFIEGVTAIDCSGRGIKSLKGIELFKGLVYLTCTNNELTELDLSQNVNIYGVACQNNKLERINLTNCSKLFQIWLDNNNLTSVDFTDCPELSILSCKNNLITTLDLRRQANITDLQCDEGVEIIYSDTPGGSEILIDANNFPDNAFRKLIADKFDWNKDGSLNASEINAITGIEAVNMGIKSLKGIEKFTALEYLTCNNNELEEIDLSGNPNFIGLAANNNRLQRVNVSKNPKLYQIWVNNNKLRALDFSQNPELAIIDCSKNLLTELDISANANLRELYFVNYPDEGSEDVDYHTLKGNAIRNIDLSNAHLLTHLACSANGIETLDISNNPLLEYIECHNNYLTKIDAGIFTELKYLHISGNKISTLDVSQNTKLQELHCGDNLLETLTLGDKPGLLKLYCYRNNLTALNIKGCPAMKELSFGGNKISAIDITNNKELESLAFWDNFVTVLDISEHVKLKDCIFGNNKVKTLNVGNKPELLRLHCYSNDLSTVDITGCPALQDFSCEGNKISVLDVTKCKELEALYCRDNPLKVLDLSECPKITNLTVDEGVKLIYTKEGTLPEILTKTLTNAITNQKYSYQLTASGATPITWTCAGKLPAGLTLSDSGLISGTPTEAGKSTFTVTAQNDYGKSSQKYTLQVFESVSITTASLKAGTIGKSYSVTLKASGTTPITWSATGLPAGLTIDSSTGKISGTPTQSGSFSVKITAKNSYSSSTKTLKLFVGVAPSITTKSLKNATLKKSYSVTLKASGTTPITWSATGLPAGLTIDSSTGKISGTSTQSGSFSVKINAKNSHGSNTKTLSLFVGVAPSITTKSLKNATLKKSYSVTLKASGTTPITWSATGLPAGLTIDGNTGNISGKPTESGSFDVNFTAKNSYGNKTKTLKLFVGIAPSITTKSLKNATLKKSYSVTLRASGTTPITWSATGLPAGLTIDGNTGKISGTSTQSGSFSVKITAKNSHGSSTKTLSLFVGVAPSITTKSLKNATLKKSYSVTLKASGTTPITWSATGLPAGLTIDSSTGKISGTSTQSGSFSVKINAKNSHGSNTKTLKLFVGIPASITTKSLTYGLVGKSYSVALKADGTATITWSLKSGSLPEGLTLTENGKISGKPTKSESSTFTVMAKNAYGSSTKKLTLKVYALPNITTKTLKNGTVAKSYSVTFKATGSGTITWTATGLPSGLSINKSTGKISGKPKVAGTFTVSVKATSTYGSKTKKFSLTISDASSNAENYTEDYSSIKTLQTLSGTTKVQAAPSATAQTESYFIAYVFDDVISVDKAGLYDFNVQLDEETPEDWSLVWIANSDKPSDDDEIVDFYDCDGAPIEVVPHDKKISVSVWLNPDRTYEPAIAVKK